MNRSTNRFFVLINNLKTYTGKIIGKTGRSNFASCSKELFQGMIFGYSILIKWLSYISFLQLSIRHKVQNRGTMFFLWKLLNIWQFGTLVLPLSKLENGRIVSQGVQYNYNINMETHISCILSARNFQLACLY